ncbi:MAG: glycosyltransferase [Chitinophagales bacterium]|nr:glycosyltransferase [Bacteroidota bacterium]MCB9042602.1 glycosyltransferase [Chitinophagales bacterium]
MTYTLSIIVPCYKPSARWATIICEKMLAYQQFSSQRELHLVVINDGSEKSITTSDLALLEKNIPNFSYYAYKENQGKGYALRYGLQHKQSDFYLITDIDFPYTLESMFSLENQLISEKDDIVSGFRNEVYYQSVPAFRKTLSQFFRWIMQKMLQLPVSDTQCGLKGFNNKGKVVFLTTQTKRFLYDLEFLLRANRNKQIKLSTCAVILRDHVAFSSYSFKVLFTELGNFLRILFNYFTGSYDNKI